MNIKAFIDAGYTDPLTFCINFLDSPEFKIGTLKNLSQSSPSNATKTTIATEIAERISRSLIPPDKIILEYVKQTRQWTTFKTGNKLSAPKLADPSCLLTEFGKDKWYGPVYDPETSSNYYIRNFSFDDFQYIGSGAAQEIRKYRIRWPLIVKLEPSLVAFFWNGFTVNTRDKISTRSQFPFWHYIPDAFDEFEDLIDADCTYPNFHKLILKSVWDRYITDPDYQWRHLAIRAEASGVALNARSAGVADIDVKGLLSLVQQLTKSVSSLPGIKNKIDDVLIENAILRTLIHEWGTKSYEFSLEQNNKKVFRAHCYFGLKPDSSVQDRFPHFKTYQAYGSTNKAVDFLSIESILG